MGAQIDDIENVNTTKIHVKSINSTVTHRKRIKNTNNQIMNHKLDDRQYTISNVSSRIPVNNINRTVTPNLAFSQDIQNINNINRQLPNNNINRQLSNNNINRQLPNNNVNRQLISNLSITNNTNAVANSRPNVLVNLNSKPVDTEPSIFNNNPNINRINNINLNRSNCVNCK